MSVHLRPLRVDDSAARDDAPVSRAPAFRAGLGVAAATWAAVAAPAALAWVAAPEASGPWTSALAIGSSGWFLGHGVPLRVDSLDVRFTPLGLFLLVLGAVFWGLRRALLGVAVGHRGTVGGFARDVLDIVVGFLGGYTLVAAGALLSTLSAGVRPHPVYAVLAVAGIVLAGASMAIPSAVPGGWRTAAPGPAALLSARLPRWTRGLARPVLSTLVALAGAGLLLVLAMIGKGGAAIGEITARLDPGAGGGVVLAVGQAAYLPNLALWALSWLSGAGFTVAAGSTVTLQAANPGLLPMVPVLAALPSGGSLPAWVIAAPAVILVCGVILGRGVLARECAPAPSELRDHVMACLVGALLVGAVTVVVTVLGAGALGVERLEQVGPPVWQFAGLVTAEVLLGALAWVGLGWLRGRRLPE
jgi:hypothetical protein